MKDEIIMYLTGRIDWYKCEQTRLRSESRADEAVHAQIAVNVYQIFLSTYQAVKHDLAAALERFSAIIGIWDENHRRALANNDFEKRFIEEIKIGRATEIVKHVKELEKMHHD